MINIDTNIQYIVTTNYGKSFGYQSKKGLDGIVKLFLPNIWDDTNNFFGFVLRIILTTLWERNCLERCFNKIKIKGGMCNPCCVQDITIEMYNAILDFIVD